MKKFLIRISVFVVSAVLGFACITVFFNPEKKPEGNVTSFPEVVEQPVQAPVVTEEEETESSAISTTAEVKTEAPIGSEITAENVFRAVNLERVARGLKPLKRNVQLDVAARMKLDDMIQNNYFAHVSPNGVSFKAFVVSSGYDLSGKHWKLGENLAHGFDDLSGLMNQECLQEPTSGIIIPKPCGWMNSPTHRDNILNSLVIDTGIAVQDGVVVQYFASQN